MNEPHDFQDFPVVSTHRGVEIRYDPKLKKFMALVKRVFISINTQGRVEREIDKLSGFSGEKAILISTYDGIREPQIVMLLERRGRRLVYADDERHNGKGMLKFWDQAYAYDEDLFLKLKGFAKEFSDLKKRFEKTVEKAKKPLMANEAS
jgi:hypothetical protein